MRRWILALACLVAAPATAGAQALEDYDYENLAFSGIGIEYGRIWPSRVEPAAAYTLRLDLGFLGPWVRIVPSVTYWSSTLEADELDRLAAQLNRLGSNVAADDLGPIDWRDASLNVDAHAVWEATPYVAGYAGLGAGLHAFDGRGEAIEGTFIEDLLDSFTAGLNGLAGVEVAPVERFKLYVEGRYTLVDDVRYPEVRIGGAFVFSPADAAGGAR